MKRIIYSIISIIGISLLMILLRNFLHLTPQIIVNFLEQILNPVVSFLAFLFLGGDYEIFGKIRNTNIFGLPILVAWLIIGGVFFTLKLRFVNIRLFKHATDVARGRYAET